MTSLAPGPQPRTREGRGFRGVSANSIAETSPTTRPTTRRAIGGGVRGEVITAAEALARVGLADLAGDHEHRTLVDWTGTPQPFACGHTDTYGYGPLDRPDENDRQGKGRRYQGLARVSQHVCSGPVLWSWACVGTGTGGHYRLRLGFGVVITHIDDDAAGKPLPLGRGSTCLRVVHMG